MTGRFVLFTSLALGGAAAVLTAHSVFGGDHFAMHHGTHFTFSDHERTLDSVRSRVDGALDQLELTPPTRARAKEILESHFDEVGALLEKIHSGKIDHDAAMTEHERILTAAKAEVASVLTPEQIEKLCHALHSQGEAH